MALSVSRLVLCGGGGAGNRGRNVADATLGSLAGPSGQPFFLTAAEAAELALTPDAHVQDLSPELRDTYEAPTIRARMRRLPWAVAGRCTNQVRNGLALTKLSRCPTSSASLRRGSHCTGTPCRTPKHAPHCTSQPESGRSAVRPCPVISEVFTFHQDPCSRLGLTFCWPTREGGYVT
jgi:hypothetical protein